MKYLALICFLIIFSFSSQQEINTDILLSPEFYSDLTLNKIDPIQIFDIAYNFTLGFFHGLGSEERLPSFLKCMAESRDLVVVGKDLIEALLREDMLKVLSDIFKI